MQGCRSNLCVKAYVFWWLYDEQTECLLNLFANLNATFFSFIWVTKWEVSCLYEHNNFIHPTVFDIFLFRKVLKALIINITQYHLLWWSHHCIYDQLQLVTLKGGRARAVITSGMNETSLLWHPWKERLILLPPPSHFWTKYIILCRYMNVSI